MDIAQTFGSSSSYARKYALNGLFAIDDTKDADTQDNTPSTKISTKPQSKKVDPSVQVKIKLGLGSQREVDGFAKYRDCKTDVERTEMKGIMSNAFSDFDEVFKKWDKDYKAYLVIKNK